MATRFQNLLNQLKYLFSRGNSRSESVVSGSPSAQFKERPEYWICDESQTTPEEFYAAMSKRLIKEHGKLNYIRYNSHYPDFEIRFTYKDGHNVYSGRRTGRYDINFLSLGYYGEGPRYAREFLSAAGFELSLDEIEKIRPGDVIDENFEYEQRLDIAVKTIGTEAQSIRFKESVFRSGKSLVSDILSKTPPVISKDGDSLLVFQVTNNGVNLVRLDVGKSAIVWSVKIESKVAEVEYTTDGEVLLLVGDPVNSAMLVDFKSGAVASQVSIPEFSQWGDVYPSGIAMAKVGGQRMSVWQRGSKIARGFEGEKIVIFEICKNILTSRIIQTHQFFGKGPYLGPDGNCYCLKYGQLGRIQDDEIIEIDGTDGSQHCIDCFDGVSLLCGGGYEDLSGDAYLIRYNTETSEASRIRIGREPLQQMHDGGEGRVLLSSLTSGSPFTGRTYSIVLMLNFDGNRVSTLWEKRFGDQPKGRSPVLLTIPEESVGVLRNSTHIEIVSLLTGDMIEKTEIDRETIVLASWSQSHRKIFFTEFESWDEDGSLWEYSFK